MERAAYFGVVASVKGLKANPQQKAGVMNGSSTLLVSFWCLLLGKPKPAGGVYMGWPPGHRGWWRGRVRGRKGKQRLCRALFLFLPTSSIFSFSRAQLKPHLLQTDPAPKALCFQSGLIIEAFFLLFPDTSMFLSRSQTS